VRESFIPGDTSSEDVTPLSRTSSLPQGVAFSLPIQFWGRINCQLLSDGRGSGPVREGAGTFREYVPP
ncbi:hypothetical protein, partial [Pseudomonas syringae]|uniref:hypothetical protein n=1 Tax=Pseudomonas syringae TaxID=317 RepID=UPI001E54F406